MRRAMLVAFLLAVGIAPAWAGDVQPPPSPPIRVKVPTGTDAAPATPSAHPDFSGTWKLNPARSKFGNVPGGHPHARTDVIEQHEPRIVQTLYLENPSGSDTTVVRRDTTVYRYTTDGKPTVNVVDNKDIKSVVQWEGGALRLESTVRIMVFEMTLSERWTMSADRKTLTMTRRITWPGGKGDQTLIFERR